ncbi:MAG: TetR/AcrR family transcriptional regulator C-terminal domain-containing protein [Actinomycetota bacterium]
MGLDQIIEAGLAIGLDDLTMTRVAKRLGVGNATLYGHVRDLDWLRDRIASEIVGELEPPVAGALGVNELLFELGTNLRRLLRAHPGLGHHLMEREVPAFQAHHERHVELLVELGLEPTSALLLAEDIPSFVLGYESVFTAPTDPDRIRSEVVQAASDATPDVSDDAVFAWTLRFHIGGLVGAIERNDLPWT